MPGSHSDLPPSSADKWLHCPAWRRLTAEKRAQPQPSSPAAEEGTRAHKVFELALRNDLPDRLTKEQETMLRILGPSLEWVDKQPGELFLETNCNYGKAFGYEDLDGHSDVVLVSPKELAVVDLKYGRHDVWPARNPQLLSYLVGAVEKFGPRPHYRLVILQPRGSHPEKIREWELDNGHLVFFMDKLEKAIEDSYRNLPPVAGEWCQHYCLALGTCRAARDHVVDLFRKTPVE